MRRAVVTAGVCCLALAGPLGAGPYSAALDDPAHGFDAPVPGFAGPDGDGRARLPDGSGGFSNDRNYVNPLFFRWALAASDYLRSDGGTQFNAPARALGPVTGDYLDVVSLGDLNAAQLAAMLPKGRITLHLTSAEQPERLRDLPGADFVIFENAFVANASTGAIFGDLAYVEVSSDGVNFARFPSVSLIPAAVGAFGTIDPTNVFQLAGKHHNAVGESWGTPFDLAALASDPLVIAGLVQLDAVRFVRLVDIPGDGSSLDAASPAAHPIFDAWPTAGSGGFDLEAVGAISVALGFERWQDAQSLAGAQRGALSDPDGDGAGELLEYAFAMRPLAADPEHLPRVALETGGVAISFRRDTRATDLTYEVLASSDLGQWDVIARSVAGGPLTAVAPFTPLIDDISASATASLGVVRRHRVWDTVPAGGAARRFFMIRIAIAP
jgi:hypothetical protein